MTVGSVAVVASMQQYASTHSERTSRKPLLSNENFYRFEIRNTALQEPACVRFVHLPMLSFVAVNALGDLFPRAQEQGCAGPDPRGSSDFSSGEQV